MQAVPSETPMFEGRNDDDVIERVKTIGVPIVVILTVLLIISILLFVLCACAWKRRERRLLRLIHKRISKKKEMNIERVGRLVFSENCSNVLGNEEALDFQDAETEFTAHNKNVTQTQGDEGYTEISEVLIGVERQNGSTQVHYENLETDGYEFDLDYQEPFWEPASREEELLHQIVELKVESISERDVEILDGLGSGQFGMVSKAKWTHRDEDGNEVYTEVAVKVMRDEATEEDKVKFLQEAAIMGQFNHWNILRILGIILDGGKLGIVVDLMHNGDLRHHLATLKDKMGEYTPCEVKQMLMSFSRQVVCGMVYLFLKEYVHRDLAARNVLVSEDGICKIADFGLSRDLQREDYYRSHGGKIPVKWTAPEALNFRKYSHASDMWSYGCLLYEIWSVGEKPFRDFNNLETLRAVLNGYRLTPPPGCPRVIYKIMIDCWHPLPESRPKASQIASRLQKPDFILVEWLPEDIDLYSEDARTIGTALENGQCLYKDLQQQYLHLSDKNSSGNANKIAQKLTPDNNDIILKEGGSKGHSEDSAR